MIIYVLIIVAILFFLSWNLLMSNQAAHLIGSLISTILLIAGMALAIANFRFHYGMHKVAHSTTYRLAPAVSEGQLKPIIYQNLGTQKKHNVVVYRHSDYGTKRHTKADRSVNNRIRLTTKKPHLVTTKIRWEYRSRMAHDWFGLAQKASVARTRNTFYISKNWQKLSVAQMKTFGRLAKQKQAQSQKRFSNPQAKAQVKQQAQAFVQSRMKKAMEKNPKMSTAQKKRVMQQAANQFRTQLKQKMMAKMVPELLKQIKG